LRRSLSNSVVPLVGTLATANGDDDHRHGW
jgi:hypothetical protein